LNVTNNAQVLTKWKILFKTDAVVVKIFRLPCATD